MKELKKDEINDLLSEFDRKDNLLSPKAADPTQLVELQAKLGTLSIPLTETPYCVVGVDILGYSQYKFEQQAFIPVLFDLIFEEAITHLQRDEYLTFHGYSTERIKERFISTGDGGFLVLNNPWEGLVFSLTFASILHLYNSHSFYPGLRNALGPTRVRYCITHDCVYLYRKNYFGPGIITNSRIMSRDALDRCLIDENTLNWFLEKINGIESLCVLTISEIARKLSLNANANLDIPPDERENYSWSGIAPLSLQNEKNPFILNLSTQKIGIITAKSQPFNVYNLFMQVARQYTDETDSAITDKFVINLGSLNTDGLQ